MTQYSIQLKLRQQQQQEPTNANMNLIWFTETGSAIRCYVCQSKYNPECADDLPANPSPDHRAYKFLVNCSTMNEPSGPLTLCRKQDQEGKWMSHHIFKYISRPFAIHTYFILHIVYLTLPLASHFTFSSHLSDYSLFALFFIFPFNIQFVL